MAVDKNRHKSPEKSEAWIDEKAVKYPGRSGIKHRLFEFANEVGQRSP